MMQTQSFVLLSFLTFAFGCDENAGSKCENDHNAAVVNQTAGNKVYCAALVSYGTCLSTAGNCSTFPRFKDAWAAAEKAGVSCSRNCKDTKADECNSKFQSGIKPGNGSTALQAGTTAFCIVFTNYTDCMTSAGNCQLDSKYKTSYDDERDTANCERTCRDDVGDKCYTAYSTATTGKEAGTKDFCDAVKTYLSCMDTSECALDPKFSPTVNQTVANAAKCAVKAPTAGPTSSAPTANATASPTNAITASPTTNGTAAPANGTAAPANGTAAPAPSNSSASPTSTPTSAAAATVYKVQMTYPTKNGTDIKSDHFKTALQTGLASLLSINSSRIEILSTTKVSTRRRRASVLEVEFSTDASNVTDALGKKEITVDGDKLSIQSVKKEAPVTNAPVDNASKKDGLSGGVIAIIIIAVVVVVAIILALVVMRKRAAHATATSDPLVGGRDM